VDAQTDTKSQTPLITRPTIGDRRLAWVMIRVWFVFARCRRLADKPDIIRQRVKSPGNSDKTNWFDKRCTNSNRSPKMRNRKMKDRNQYVKYKSELHSRACAYSVSQKLHQPVCIYAPNVVPTVCVRKHFSKFSGP